jgi:hypothetical protein
VGFTSYFVAPMWKHLAAIFPATAHLATSKRIFEMLVAKVRSFPERAAAECIASRDYESLERLVLEHLLAA